jgi:hypothetical protein
MIFYSAYFFAVLAGILLGALVCTGVGFIIIKTSEVIFKLVKKG